MRKEDFDPARLPKGYSVEHERITRVQKSDPPPDVLPEVWSSLTKAQKKAARKHYDDTVAADAAPMQQTTPGPSAGAALGSLSTAEDVPGKSNLRPHDTLTPVMPCCAFTGSMWKHRRKWDVQSPFSGLAIVARPVKAKEIASDAAAKAAMGAEWSSLRAMKTWEEDKVRS